MRRRHHCRHCGGIFCDSCSTRKVLLPVQFNCSEIKRVCDPCFNQLESQQGDLRSTISAASQNNDFDENSAKRYFNSPLAFTLEKEIHKAAYCVLNFTSGSISPDRVIPLPLLRRARGLAFLTVVKIGIALSAKMGTGLVVARLPDGTWSAPSAIGTVGMGWGAQIGGEVTDYIILLNTQEAVNAFSGQGQLTLGGEVGVAMGPIGRSAAGTGYLGDGGMAAAFTYSHSKGLFFGLSLEGAVISARPDVNAAFYGTDLPRDDLLGGRVPPPRAALPLYNALAAVTVTETEDV